MTKKEADLQFRETLKKSKYYNDERFHIVHYFDSELVLMAVFYSEGKFPKDRGNVYISDKLEVCQAYHDDDKVDDTNHNYFYNLEEAIECFDEKIDDLLEYHRQRKEHNNETDNSRQS